MKNSCTNCQYYEKEKTVTDGYEPICGGLALVPKSKVIKAHCTKHPRIFAKWWEANKHKTRENIDNVPKCFLLHESQRPLEKMIDLCNEILEKI